MGSEIKNIDLRPYLKAQMAPRKRVRGRYNSSEFYAITHGWVTPEKWLIPEEKTIKEMLVMWNGTGMHNQVEGLLGVRNSEEKKEFVYKDIVLVGKVDFLPPHEPDEVWEFKTSEKLMDRMKPWAEHQVKLYCTMFNKKRGLIYQPVKNEDGIYLKHLGTALRDDNWFEAEMKKLYEFHLKVEEIISRKGVAI